MEQVQPSLTTVCWIVPAAIQCKRLTLVLMWRTLPSSRPVWISMVRDIWIWHQAYANETDEVIISFGTTWIKSSSDKLLKNHCNLFLGIKPPNKWGQLHLFWDLNLMLPFSICQKELHWRLLERKRLYGNQEVRNSFDTVEQWSEEGHIWEDNRPHLKMSLITFCRFLLRQRGQLVWHWTGVVKVELWWDSWAD